MTLTTSGIDYTVDVAFGIDPLAVPSGGDWQDVTTYVRAISTRRGRNHELGRTQAGVATITLDNRDRRFDPTFADANLVPLQNQRDVEAALGANELTAVQGAVVARTTTAGQFSQGIAGLSITAHASNTFSGATVGQAAGTTNVVAVEGGVTYTFGVQLKGSAGHTFIIRARWLDSGGTAIINTDSPNTVVGTGFNKHTLTATAPALAAFVRFQILYPAAGATQVMYADELQVESGFTSRPWPAAAPYYPDVVPMAHIRIRATYAAVTYPVFYGFVEDWGQGWPEPAANGQGDALVSVQAVDAFKVFNMLAVRTLGDEILTDGPSSWWSFGEPAAAEVAHAEGSHAADMTIDTALMTFGAAGPLVGGATALDVEDIDGTFVDTAELTPDPLNLSVEFWLNSDAVLGIWVRYEADHSGGGNAFTLSTIAGNIWRFQYTTPTTSEILDLTGSTVTFSAWQHWVFTRAGGTVIAYRNGVEVARAVGVATVMPIESDARFAIAETGEGSLAHLAVYDHALTPNRIATHYATTLGEISAVSSGTALGYVLDAAAWPVGLRDLEAGVSTVTLTPSGSALDLVQQIAEDTEHGLVLMAADNDVTFIGRDTLESSVTSVATFGDAAGEVPYHDLTLAYDDQDLWTEVTASSEAGTATVTDAAAATRYGTRSLEVSGSTSTVNELSDVAYGLLGRYKAPAVRPVTLVLNKPAAYVQQLSRLIGDRVTLKRRPPGGGTVTVEALVEGIDHDAGPDGYLTTTLHLVPAETLTPWILADATYGVLDSTTRLGW
jgi:hypothetical protein